jgi:hypothetical protein
LRSGYVSQEHGWESYHSELNPSSEAYTPARQIAGLLGLVGRPQTFDLYELDGRRASATFRYSGQFSGRQGFTYLRKVLLDRYLEESGQRQFWNIYGGRGFFDPDPGATDPVEDGPPYLRYEEIRMYDYAEP